MEITLSFTMDDSDIIALDLQTLVQVIEMNVKIQSNELVSEALKEAELIRRNARVDILFSKKRKTKNGK